MPRNQMEIARGKHGAFLRPFYARIGYAGYRHDFVAKPLDPRWAGNAAARQEHHHTLWLLSVKPPLA